MFKNKKGFSLIELLAIILIIGILTNIAIPNYRTSSVKARIVTNMPLLRSLQNDILNYYHLNNRLPQRLQQLAINRGEFTDEMVHRATNCQFTLEVEPGVSAQIVEDCNDGWTLEYPVTASNIGYQIARPIFSIQNDTSRLHKIARSFNWELDGQSGDRYFIR